MFGRFLKGISWIEIVVLVGILISLVVMTVPRYQIFQCRAKQSEARFELARIHSAEKLYYAKYGRYVAFEELLKRERILPNDRFYRYESAADLTANTFLIQAEGRSGTQVEGDVWTVDQEKKLVNSHNVCFR